MNQTTALLWKERREHRWFLIGGWLLFLGFPLTMATCAYFLPPPQGGKFYSDTGVAMVIYFGPVLAIFLAVASTCRDLDHNLLTFWRSRPVPLGTLFITKYITGLATFLLVIYATFILYLTMSVTAVGRANVHLAAPAPHHYVLALVLVYSVSFLIGCLVRNAARAAILSGMAALLLYLLPLVLPPLDSLGILNLLMRSQAPPAISSTWFQRAVIGELPFITATLIGGAACVILSIQAVQRGWRLTVDKRLICWTLVAVALILWSATAFPLASNLTCERQYPAGSPEPGGDRVAVDMDYAGTQGALLLFTRGGHPGGWGSTISVQRFDLSAPDVTVGREVVIGDRHQAYHGWARSVAQVAWSPDHPQRAYVLQEDEKTPTGDGLAQIVLHTVAFDRARGAVIHDLDILKHLANVPTGSTKEMYLHGNVIYLYVADFLLLIDLRDPDAPEVSAVYNNVRSGWYTGDGVGRNIGGLITMPVGEMPLGERLQASLRLTPVNGAIDLQNDMLVEATLDRLATYRFVETADRTGDLRVPNARFEMIGCMKTTPLERIIPGQPHRVLLRDGLAYVLEHSSGMTVYNVRHPQRPRRVGHYAAPGEYFYDLAPLPDGRTLLAGTSLRVIAPPAPDRLR